MPTFDLHFHTNIHRMPKRNKSLRLQKIRWYLDRSQIDYLASTEHSYKKPLEAYQRLAEAVVGLKTEIIPGVEAVSAEGIDIIYLFRTEDAFKQALSHCKTFQWSIHDVSRICRDNEAISIIPHPFHIGKSSAGNILSYRAYQRLLKMADYVEIHNGSALNVDKRLAASRTRGLFKKTQLKLDKTLNLPEEYRGEGLGWAVSSDAHYPGEQYVVGTTDLCPGSGEDVFDFLKRRIHFDTQMLIPPSENRNLINIKLLRSLQSILKEGLTKKYIKAKGTTQALAVLGAYYGVFPAP